MDFVSKTDPKICKLLGFLETIFCLGSHLGARGSQKRPGNIPELIFGNFWLFFDDFRNYFSGISLIRNWIVWWVWACCLLIFSSLFNCIVCVRVYVCCRWSLAAQAFPTSLFGAGLPLQVVGRVGGPWRGSGGNSIGCSSFVVWFLLGFGCRNGYQHREQSWKT